jgi:hypothetical protein
VHKFFKHVKAYLEQEPTGIKYDAFQLLNDGMLTHKGLLYIPSCDNLNRFIMDELHKTPYSDHRGFPKMITATLLPYIVLYLSQFYLSHVHMLTISSTNPLSDLVHVHREVTYVKA